MERNHLIASWSDFIPVPMKNVDSGLNRIANWYPDLDTGLLVCFFVLEQHITLSNQDLQLESSLQAVADEIL